MLTKLYLFLIYSKINIIFKLFLHLFLALIKYGIKWRIDVRSINNFPGIKSHVKNAIIKSGESICNIRSPFPKKNWKRRNIVIYAIERKKILAKTGTNTK